MKYGTDQEPDAVTWLGVTRHAQSGKGASSP